MRIGYLMSHYPAVSHVFVLREVTALRDLGVDVETLSIHRAPPEALLADADRDAAATTFSVLPASPLRLLRAHLSTLLRAPRAYLETALTALRTGPPGLRPRLLRLAYFGEAMIAADHVRRRAITHLHAQFADSATDVAMLVSHYSAAAGDEPVTWSLAVHGPVEFDDVTRFALAAKLARARFAVAISDFGRSQLMRLVPYERWNHVHVVHCGVNPEVYVASPAAVEPDRVTILYVGRLIHMKGSSLLVDAVAQLVDEGHDVMVKLVGEGDARAELQRHVAELGLGERVQLLGAVGQDELREVYAEADIFCLPSFAEGIPVVAMEAMAMATPVVITRIMGIPELVDHERTGLLIAPGRLDQLTDALRRLVTSPELRAELGAAGRDKVSAEFDVRVSAQVMQQVLTRELGEV